VDDLPLFPIAIVLLPQEDVPLHIFEPRYRELAARCLEGDEPFAMVFEDDSGQRSVGCTARIIEVLEKFDDGRSNILVRGEEPVAIEEVHDDRSYSTATASPLADSVDRASEDAEAEALAAFADLQRAIGDDAEPPVAGLGLSYALAGRVDWPAATKQSLLEERDEGTRLRRVTLLLQAASRGLALADAAQERARRNGRVRTADELAAELGIDDPKP
jgi:Lon protease-like protein